MTSQQPTTIARQAGPSPYRMWLREVAYNVSLAYREATSGILAVEGVRGVISPEARLNSCIEATRVMVDTFTLLGVKARPQPVDVMAGNRAALPQLMQERPFTAADEQAGAWTVGVHHTQPHDGGGWNGHLVAILARPESEGGGRTLIDATSDQFSRPEHQMVIAPILFLDIPKGYAWTPSDPIFPAIPPGQDEQGGIVRYTPMPPGHSNAKIWRDSPAWNNPILPEIAAEVARQIGPPPA